MSLDYLQALQASLIKQRFWLDYSYQQIQTSTGIEHFDIEQFNQFENLCSRYARTIDFLVRKVFRCLDDVEFETQGTLIDVVNRAHKRGFFDDIKTIRDIKDIRNDIVHEYLDDGLQAVFIDIMRTTPDLLLIVDKSLAYIEELI